MAIQFTCPHCGHQTDVDDQFAGKSGPCASCGQTISIPWSGTGATAATASTRKTSTAALVLIGIGVMCGALFVLTILALLLLPAVNAAREAARRNQCLNNARAITLALEAYYQEHGNYPPAYTVDDSDRPLHSWRVLILPYLGPEEAALYSRLDLSQPWDAEVNRRWISEMPTVYACPSDSGVMMGETSYCVVTGPGYMFDGEKTVKKSDITDGVSQTLMLVEVVNSGIEWMDPRDVDRTRLALGINSGSPGCCGSNHVAGVALGFADSNVQFMPDITTPEELHEMATIAGNELVSP